MSEDQPNSKKRPGANPVAAIAVAILVAALLSGASLVVFLRSDTRKNIQLVQDLSDTELSGEAGDTPDETSPLTASDLDSIKQKILDRAKQVAPEEFGSSELTDAALGL